MVIIIGLIGSVDKIFELKQLVEKFREKRKKPFCYVYGLGEGIG